MFTGQFVVWYGNNNERPWRVRLPDGRVMQAKSVDMVGDVRTAFSDTGFEELPGGPRGVVVASGLWYADAQELSGP